MAANPVNCEVGRALTANEVSFRVSRADVRNAHVTVSPKIKQNVVTARNGRV
jgi:hypothetical protein